MHGRFTGNGCLLGLVFWGHANLPPSAPQEIVEWLSAWRFSAQQSQSCTLLLELALLSLVQSSYAGWEDSAVQPPSGSAAPASQASHLPDVADCWHGAGREELARAGATMAEVLAHRPPASDLNLQRELASIHRYLCLDLSQLAASAGLPLSILMPASV